MPSEIRGSDNFDSDSAGKVLQVVNTVIDTTASTTSSTYVPSIIALSITPTSNTSKILVSMNIKGGSDKGSFTVFRLYRDTTHITAASSNVSVAVHGTTVSGFLSTNYRPVTTHQENVQVTMSNQYLDSPNTTSSVSYNLYWRQRGGGASYINRAQAAFNDHNDYSVSTITLTEIGD